MNRLLKRLATTLAGLGLLGSALGNSTQACTSFTLKGNDGGHVYGSTMEWGQPLNSAAVLIQRGTSLKGNGPGQRLALWLAVWVKEVALMIEPP